MRRRTAYTALLSIALLGAAACGQDPANPGTNSGGGGTGPTVTIMSPANGASVNQPFMLQFSTSEKLGKINTGLDHVHVFADGKADQYTVVSTSPFEIKNLTPGQHTIGVTLQHADHSSAGAGAEITVMVTGGPAPGGAATTDPGYGY
jgi:hypothetical protein